MRARPVKSKEGQVGKLAAIHLVASDLVRSLVLVVLDVPAANSRAKSFKEENGERTPTASCSKQQE